MRFSHADNLRLHPPALHPLHQKTQLRKEEKSWNDELKMETLGVEDLKVPFELQVEHLVKVVRGEEELIIGVRGARFPPLL